MLYRFILATGILMAFTSQNFSQVGINTTELQLHWWLLRCPDELSVCNNQSKQFL